MWSHAYRHSGSSLITIPTSHRYVHPANNPNKYAHMRTLTLATAIFIAACANSWAGHSQDNGTCIDDTVHWQNMINKRTDAPLWNESKATQSEAMAANVQGDWEKCEELMAEALRMIKKTAGEYPTE